MAVYRRAFAIAALIAVALLASRAFTWTSREAMVAGHSVILSGRLLMGLVVVGLACTGTDALMRAHPAWGYGPRSNSLVPTILPSLLAAAGWMLVVQARTLASGAAGAVLLSGALIVIMVLEYWSVDPSVGWRSAAVMLPQLSAYPVAVVLYLALGLALPATLVPLAVAAGSTPLALRALGDCDSAWRRSLASAGVGLALGGASWLLVPRPGPLLTSSLLLTVVLYVLVGSVRHYLRHGRLERQVLLEHLAIGLGLGVLIVLTLR